MNRCHPFSPSLVLRARGADVARLGFVVGLMARSNGEAKPCPPRTLGKTSADPDVGLSDLFGGMSAYPCAEVLISIVSHPIVFWIELRQIEALVPVLRGYTACLIGSAAVYLGVLFHTPLICCQSVLVSPLSENVMPRYFSGLGPFTLVRWSRPLIGLMWTAKKSITPSETFHDLVPHPLPGIGVCTDQDTRDRGSLQARVDDSLDTGIPREFSVTPD